MNPTLKLIYSASAVLCIVAMLGMPCMAQRKLKPRYYKVEWSFALMNGCYDSGYSTYKSMNISYGDIIHGVAQWIKPYKIKPGTFIVEQIKEINKTEFNMYKGNKFIACSHQSISLSFDAVKWQNLKPMVAMTDSIWKTIPDSIRYRISNTFLNKDTLLIPVK